MKLVHAADLHIDSPLRGLDRYEGAPAARLRGATRHALENLVALCIDERASLLLLAGDVFDGGWKDYSTGLFFVAQMARLQEAGVEVVVVRGNHDAQSTITKNLTLPKNVRELSSRKAESVEVGGVVVHGQSFASKATSDDLARGYPAAVSGAVNIGILHTSLDGREGHDPYAPTTLETLKSKGYDYWALGHVHAREVLSKEPWIVFPGNLQGRHAKETGPKGASVLTVEEGAIASVEHRALDVVRWEQVSVDASEASDAADAIDRVRAALDARADAAEGRILAARVVVSGACRANAAIRADRERFVAEVRAAAAACGSGDVWVEKVKVETRAAVDLAKVREEASAVGHFARRLRAVMDDPKELAALAGIFADLEKKLPPEAREAKDGDAPLLSDAAWLRAVVEDVEQSLVPRLLEGGEK